ncbi:hypothetical protein CEXT_427831 [Caerostris extrusa]|uniref:Uncharacterized protein n=1 Tax=Caerostris extrusa TaxID=172846 RepID=A0AAV4XFT6_CAEEX|nr:hypothetical protein CEXT_427831 [Caerostris extrusa]
MSAKKNFPPPSTPSHHSFFFFFLINAHFDVAAVVVVCRRYESRPKAVLGTHGTFTTMTSTISQKEEGTVPTSGRDNWKRRRSGKRKEEREKKKKKDVARLAFSVQSESVQIEVQKAKRRALVMNEG